MKKTNKRVKKFKTSEAVKKLSTMSPAEQADYIKEALGYTAYERPHRAWLNTGSPYHNQVFGSKKRGARYGSLIVLAGKKSSGKTLEAAILAGIGQSQGAQVGWVDLEDSFDGRWVKIHGLDPGERRPDGTYTNIALFRPEFGMLGKLRGDEKTQKEKRDMLEGLRMETAEEMFERAEKWMMMQRRISKELGRPCRVILVVDSATASVPREQMQAGIARQNMRTMQLAPFLNNLLKRWTNLAPNVNALIIFISQLRTNPGQMFGNPEYVPGGAGILFYPHCVTLMRRAKKGGLMLNADEEVMGLRSVFQNVKNKVGGGSVEGKKCGVKLYFEKGIHKYMNSKLIDKKDKK